LAYVEIFRNTPLLIQVIFWYIGVFTLLPKVKNSVDLSGGAEVLLLNNRGFYMPWPVPSDLLWMTGLAFIVAIIAVVIFKRWANTHQDKTGQIFPTFIPSVALLVLLPGIVYLITGMPLAWDIPKLGGFNFAGGASLPPSFIALLVALSLYHASHMAESVRAGVLSVGRGQYDAARALGLREKRVMSLVIIPQAMPAIVPPMISNYRKGHYNPSLKTAMSVLEVDGVTLHPFATDSLEYEIKKVK